MSGSELVYRGRCLKKRCGFTAEGPNEPDVEQQLRDHVKAKHRIGARIEIERPLFTYTPEEGLRDVR